MRSGTGLVLLALATAAGGPGTARAQDGAAPLAPEPPRGPPPSGGTTAAAAPEPRRDRVWTVSAGTGAGSIFEFADAFVNDLGSGLAGLATERRGRLQLNLRADREIARRVRAGLAYTYLRWTTDYLSSGVVQGSVDTSFHVLLGDVTLQWVRSERVELYSGAGMGAALARRRASVSLAVAREDAAGFGFQLRLLGLALGGEHLRAFGELGLGFEGLLIGGLALRF